MNIKNIFKNNGLSLVEIIVSLAFIGIIAITFLPMFIFGYKYIYFAGNKSLSSYQAQDEIENSIATEDSFSAETLRLDFKNGPMLEIQGGLVDSLKVNSGAESSMTTFVSLIPTMTMNIVELFEGYDPVTIIVNGDRTNFSLSQTNLSIRDKYGFPIYHVLTSIQSIEQATQQGVLYISEGLTNQLSPYKLTMTTGNEIVSAKLVINPRFKYAIVGTSRTIFVSTDGVLWYSDKWGSDAEFRSVTYGNGIFYAVGDSGKLISSSAAISWTSNNQQITDFYNTAYVDNSDIYLGGDGGIIQRSNNLIDWTSLSSNTDKNLNKIIKFSNSKYITIGNEGVILTSLNGVDWVSIGDQLQDLYSVTWGDNKYVIVGNTGTILLSEDDATTFSKINVVDLVENLKSIIYANGKFVAVGQNGTIIYSSDAESWTKISLSTPVGNLNDITWGDGRYIAIGDNNIVLTSNNLTNWSINQVATANIGEIIDLQSIIYAQN